MGVFVCVCVRTAVEHGFAKKRWEDNFLNTFCTLPDQVMYLMGIHISHRPVQAADTVKWRHEPSGHNVVEINLWLEQIRAFSLTFKEREIN